MLRAVDHHFKVFSASFDEDTLTRRAIESLDKAYWRVGDALGLYPPGAVPVVFHTAEEFRQITRAPDWASGAYDGTIRIPMREGLSRREELDRVLAHEFTHAVVRMVAPRGVPEWLDEGLAAALEQDSLDWARRRIASYGGPMPADRLWTPFDRFNARDAELAYATSAVTANRILDTAGAHAVSNFLRDLAAGQAFESAFVRRIHRPFAEFTTR